jgi:hypothetical protein
MSKLAFLFALGACAPVFGQSAWLPEPGQFVVAPVYSYQTYDRYWSGKNKVTVPLGARQQTTTLGLEYGLCRFAAADVTAGYSWSESRGFNAARVLQNDDGLVDTSFGLRLRVLDEKTVNCKFAPTLTLRAGGIVAGTYNPNTAFSAGDGANGYEGSLLFGKAICSGFGLYGDIGYRVRDSHVPDEVFGSAGAYATWKSFTLSGGYRSVQSLTGLDIGGPGFSPLTPGHGFPQLKEENQSLEAALGYTDKGGRYYQFFYAHTIAGRNTGEKDVFGVSATFPLGGK